ncbi:uncharacterized protein LOC134510562 [Chroicocephalus ridibundus]|uniref:uncharacterized protein LOC134510562 n=1 Tax=Chroicocephalus ridibundus TaxID=1192867 RepID=UPI002FDDFF42
MNLLKARGSKASDLSGHKGITVSEKKKIHHPAIMFTLHQDKQKFLFASQTQFSVSLDLPFSQRQTVVQQPKANTDIWLKQPPDFSYQLYRSSNPSLNPRERGKGELKPKITSEFIAAPSSQKTKGTCPSLSLAFPRIGSYEAKILFVENGKCKTGVYEDPEPHDYRQVQYTANLPNLVISYSRHPLNLKLRSQDLNIDPGLDPLRGKQKDSDRRFLTYKPCESKWDPRLLLPKNPWPPKSDSFAVS